MKRIQAACICQTLSFRPKDPMDPKAALRLSEAEVASYKDQLEKRHTRYKVVEEVPQPDGSILVKILKQYNSAPVGDYLN